MAKEYKALDERVEVNGRTVLSFVAGFGSMRRAALDVLRKCGIDEPAFDEWYPQQKWLDAFTYISNNVSPQTLYEIGTTIPDNADFPKEIVTVHDALAAIDVAYHINHRIDGALLFDEETGEKKAGIGNYHYRFIGKKAVEMICDNPYPCDFDRGIIYAMTKRFKSDGGLVNIKHEKEEGCRDNGDKSCRYLVTW